MEKEIKSIQLVDTENFVKTLNNKFQNIDKIYKIFEESVGKNKWTSVPNKNLYFNKEIMACYPNFLNNFQNIAIDVSEGYDNALQIIKNNQEYGKYKIKWDLSTAKETTNSYYKKEHPFEEGNSKHYLRGYNYIVCKDNKTLKIDWIDSNENSSKGLLIPIYRLGNDKDYELLESNNTFFNYPIEVIFKIFLEKELIIDKISEDKELRSEFIKLSQVYSFIKDFKVEYNKIKIVWDIEKIINEIVNNQDKGGRFIGTEVEVVFNNSVKEIRKYEKNKAITTHFFKNGDKEEFTYINGIREGITKFIYSNGDSEEAKYVNGSLEGKAIYTYKNGNKKEFIYSNNQANGKATFTYSNGDKEITNYNSGKLEGKSSYIYSNGDKEEREYKDGKLQGESIYTYTNKNVETRYYVDGILQGEAILESSNGDITRLYYTNGVKKDVTNMYNILNVDKTRINLDTYDENILYDIGAGHWDLFDNSKKEELESEIGKKVYGRDPRLDIKKGGIVGIDFGTKSTVVVFQDDKNITLPMRISGTILNKKVEESDYENPTVIEFKDIERFMNDYNASLGRPLTKWEDVTVSHTAFANLVNGSGENYYSIISELKQWAGSKKDKLLLKDKQGVEKLLNSYLGLNEEDIDPIEIYAYYIGSYINNMRNGIYLEYFLSFPVTYEKEIREKILASFTRGIKKSLPKVILEDENVMKKFKVKHGANEPAAYAVCALQQYGFDPEDNEKIYYGVFDFGGGTLDFDFGIFRESEDSRYDYDLEYFGAGGDRYLGGENILKELAFETFKENISILREKGITFIRPEWCDRFMGDETIVDSNGNSKLNTKLLMEKLRGVWENSEERVEERIKLNLFDKNGEQLTGIDLDIDEEKLKKKIYSKIEGGVKNFFIAMEKAFKNDEYDKVYILLAGNSCKHPLVKEIFEKYIQEKNMNIEILPALGTEEAYLKLEELGIAVDRNDKTKPTGKTGVAYGLLESTADSCIKIINRDEERNDEINFKYYVGNEKKKKLKPVLNPSTEYNTFNLFSYVKSDVFNIYYTTLPEASEGKLPIESVKRVRITLDNEYDSETMIYLRAVGADTIEYAVTKKDINEKEYLESGKIVLD